MIEISPLAFLLLIELLLLLGLACGVFLFQSLRRRKRDYRAALKLVEAVQQDAESRKSTVQNLLERDYRYAGDELDQTTRNLLHAEKLFYQTFINAYLSRDAHRFSKLNNELAALTDIYEQLTIPSVEVDAGGDGSNREVEMQYLQDKNQRLCDELSETMDTMGRMLSEYSSMFGHGGEASEDGAYPADIEDTVQNDADESDSVESEVSMQAAGDADSQGTSSGDDLSLESLEATENEVDGLLQDVARQVEKSVDAPVEEPEELDLEILDDGAIRDEPQAVEQKAPLDGFEDLEEIDIEADIPSQTDEGKSQAC